jgi:hypothetical protein
MAIKAGLGDKHTDFAVISHLDIDFIRTAEFTTKTRRHRERQMKMWRETHYYSSDASGFSKMVTRTNVSSP